MAVSDTDALAQARGRVAADDGDPLAWEALARALSTLGRTDEAADALERAEARAASRGVALVTAYQRAELLRQRARYAEAAAMVEGALATMPHPAGYFMLAELAIVQGRFASGFACYEFRQLEAQSLAERRDWGVPEWTGQPLAGATVLVESEQGVGDVVWFARYLPMLKARGAHVVLLPREDMQSFARRLPGVDLVLREGERLPRLDFHVRLMSLAHRFGTTLATVPGGVPYLAPDPERAKRWAERIPDDGVPRVGLVWAGRPDQPRDRFRSLDAARLAPLLRVPGVRFHSLQKGYAEAQLASLPPEIAPVPTGARCEDLDDLCAAIDRMDLVISVCTAPAHIAGAMGKPVWTMIATPADMRWLDRGDDSPWYPTLRLFRQREPGHWDDVIADVAGALASGPSAWRAQPARAPRAEVADDASRLLDTIVEAHGVPFMARVAGPGVPARSSDPARRIDALVRALGLCRPGGTVLETGSGIGGHALPIARALGPEGRLYAFEPDERTRRLLKHNLASQRIGNVALLDAASIDALALARLDGVKLDDAATAASVLERGEATLWRDRPWILAACGDEAALAERLAALGYRAWLIAAPAGAERSVLALPEEADVRGTPEGCVKWP